MVRYATEDVAIKVYYLAHRSTSGLSDVKVTIIRLSDNATVVDALSMTEVGSLGMYEYEYTFGDTGNFLVKCDSDSLPSLFPEIYEVVSGYVSPSPASGAYIGASDVRDVTSQDLTTDDISDNDLNDHISNALAQVNNDICLKIYEEPVVSIDNYRTNYIDSSNTVYYIPKSWEFYIGDLDDDGEITTSDIKVYLYDTSDSSRTEATVSAIDETGKVTLSSAPSGNVDKITMTYRRSPVSISDRLLLLACGQLTASMAYCGLDSRKKGRVGIRGFVISRDPQAAKDYRNRYLKTIALINSRQPVVLKQRNVKLKKLGYLHSSPYDRGI